jgi:hypothetical protein
MTFPTMPDFTSVEHVQLTDGESAILNLPVLKDNIRFTVMRQDKVSYSKSHLTLVQYALSYGVWEGVFRVRRYEQDALLPALSSVMALYRARYIYMRLPWEESLFSEDTWRKIYWAGNWNVIYERTLLDSALIKFSFIEFLEQEP